MEDARPFFFKIYVDGFHSPELIRRDGDICDRVIEGLVAGDFWKVEGFMLNGQRFIMRRKQKNGTGSETDPVAEFFKRTYGRLGKDFDLDY